MQITTDGLPLVRTVPLTFCDHGDCMLLGRAKAVVMAVAGEIDSLALRPKPHDSKASWNQNDTFGARPKRLLEFKPLLRPKLHHMVKGQRGTSTR